MSEHRPTDPIVPSLQELVDWLNQHAMPKQARKVGDAILVIDELTRRLEVMREDCNRAAWYP